MTTQWGSARTSGARIEICRACGGGFIPPAQGNCCSSRCVKYLEVAHQPVLGNPVYCQRDEPITCWGCQVSFRSSGLRYCPECWARPGSVTPEVTLVPPTPVAPRPARHDEPIIERNPRSRCYW
jgi:hypothetical protein